MLCAKFILVAFSAFIAVSAAPRAGALRRQSESRIFLLDERGIKMDLKLAEGKVPQLIIWMLERQSTLFMSMMNLKEDKRAAHLGDGHHPWFRGSLTQVSPCPGSAADPAPRRTGMLRPAQMISIIPHDDRRTSYPRIGIPKSIGLDSLRNRGKTEKFIRLSSSDAFRIRESVASGLPSDGLDPTQFGAGVFGHLSN
ncbi:hypothetical protein C8J56DRAFT_891735 [Mycena floridula]|nr:hypothetical protein C8J56DRAFT_891735 [Mycena floridula]